MATKHIREEEVKNRLRQDLFSTYDATPIQGNIDFAVAVPSEQTDNEEKEYLLWAEAKQGKNKDIYASLVQLILTIGRAHTYDRYLPPLYLGAFDEEKICFVRYESVIDVFAQNDFNWNVTPSDHSTKEFRQLYALIEQSLERESLLFRYEADAKELVHFVRHGFRTKSTASRIRISKTNFIHIYQNGAWRSSPPSTSTGTRRRWRSRRAWADTSPSSSVPRRPMCSTPHANCGATTTHSPMPTQMPRTTTSASTFKAPKPPRAARCK